MENDGARHSRRIRRRDRSRRGAALPRARRDAAGRRPAERYDGIVNEAIEAARRLIAPKGIYVYAAGRELPGSNDLRAPRPDGLLRLHDRPRARGRGDEALDAAASCSRRSCSTRSARSPRRRSPTYIDAKIAAEAAREGLKTSCRASPGYGDWDVREQAAIFKLLPAERIGVRLSETFMMIAAEVGLVRDARRRGAREASQRELVRELRPEGLSVPARVEGGPPWRRK